MTPTKRIAYITDLHAEEDFPRNFGVDEKARWYHILDDLKHRGITDIIFGGDIGSPVSNAWFFDSLKDFFLDITLGNHDIFEEVTQYFGSDLVCIPGALCYSKEDQFFRYIFLDSSKGVISKEQLNWLDNELQFPKRKLVFIHHPVIGIDVEADRAYTLLERDQVLDILTKSDQPITLFCGHYHMDDFTSFQNVEQYITPASSVQVEKHPSELIFNGDSYAYRIITLDDDSVSTELIQFS